MDKQEYLIKISKTEIDEEKVKKVSQKYGANLPDILKKIISNADTSEFFDDGSRILSFDEIMDAENDLHVAFASNGMIPFADCGENDFLVYHFYNDIWSKFNIIDESVFKKKPKIEDLLK
jgi:hypothetical protein